MSKTILLKNRVAIEITGADAAQFLQGVITQDVTAQPEGEARYGALLTPQGKVICAGLWLRTDKGFLVDTPAQADAALVKRLTMLKLRADVSIQLRDDLACYVFADADLHDLHYKDPRSPLLPLRAFKPQDRNDACREQAWHEVRIRACIPEQGRDFGENEVFPTDINMDLLHGVDFKKGCFVGQEVVSRMKRRANIRRRTVPFHFPKGAPPSETAIEIGDSTIGILTSTEGEYALGRIRLDRMTKAIDASGEIFTADGREAELIRPDWLENEISALDL